MYSSVLQFLREQQPGYVTFLIRTRVLPLYAVSMFLPYLVASANWVLGELASCLPEVRYHNPHAISIMHAFIFYDKAILNKTSLFVLVFPLLNCCHVEIWIADVMHSHISSSNFVVLLQELCADIYSSLVKALSMSDKEEISFYPVRVSAAGAIPKLLEVGFFTKLVRSSVGFILFCFPDFHQDSIVFLFRMTTFHLSGYLFFKS